MDADQCLEEPLIGQEVHVETSNTEESPESAEDEERSQDDAILNPWKNHNVRLSFLLCIVSGIADSIWGSVVLSGFLFALGKAMGKTKEENTLVGLAEMVQGLTMLIFALPIGLLADKTGKARVVRWGGALLLLTVGITLWALLVINREASESQKAADQSYYILLVALGLWGICGGILNGPSQALFSDSIPKGRRSELLTYLYSSYLISAAVGPLVGIIMLSQSNEEDWSLKEIFPVFFVGVLLEIPAGVLCFFFSEKYTVPEPDDEPRPVDESIETLSIDNPEQTETANVVPSLLNGYGLTKAAVPYVLFFSSLVVSLGSGASVKYFPLFFKEIGLRSEVVQGIFLTVPVSISFFSFVSQKISQSMGRVETSVMFNVCGVLMLYFMTWLSHDIQEGDTSRRILIVGVYLLRTGIMNCPYPLLESILMDAVPSNQRARWKSLESIASFGWTGSALLGGILSDSHSYEYTFAITATMQLVGGLMLIPIQHLVEREQVEPISDEDVADETRTDLEEPLLTS
ncbi:hypothetical protein FisN_22Hh119 [Fistulifera solaris]|jgi:MFS family permease|uniref:Major facilitator superfamily (MFS) profile domain-containing protein n=1 Tax=Fistulifera solaris TaxID=1519565 RepID=A0A1Z5JPQ4_FISSO|nr:hypothetical protein FisN_22Hh119 [Fistulifera solaris]|eukprot:GAX16023.1 hypothetical protein FisN_22Hh119 [Fistulifera solaris]